MNQPVTKQELQNALSQNYGSLASRIVSRQDICSVMNELAARLCTKQEIHAIFENSRDRFYERSIGPVLRDQQNLLRQTVNQLETFSRQVAEVNLRLDYLQSILKTVKGEVDEAINRQSAVDTRVFNRTYATQS
jgi:DNA repair ATPase RecN